MIETPLQKGPKREAKVTAKVGCSRDTQATHRRVCCHGCNEHHYAGGGGLYPPVTNGRTAAHAARRHRRPSENEGQTGGNGPGIKLCGVKKVELLRLRSCLFFVCVGGLALRKEAFSMDRTRKMY
eukprot:3778715-Rhodomonas_salina.1